MLDNCTVTTTVLDSLKHSAFKKGAISSINELINMTGHTAYDEPDYHREFLYLDSDDAYNIGEWNEGKKDFHHHSWKDYVSYIELTSWVYCDEIVQLNDKGMDVMYVTER